MSLILSIVFSTIGLLYLKLAKNLSNIPVGIAGITLLGYVFFTQNVWWLLGIGLALSIGGLIAMKVQND